MVIKMKEVMNQLKNKAAKTKWVDPSAT